MPKNSYHGPLERVDECCWRIPRSYKPGMRVDGLIFSDEKILPQIQKDQAPEQVAIVRAELVPGSCGPKAPSYPAPAPGAEQP